MSSRPLTLAVALAASVVVALSGCTGPSQGTLATNAGHSSLSGWRLDCSLGSYEKGAWLQPCEARASHTEGQKQEVWLAINPTDPRNVVIGAKDLNPAASASCVWNGLFVTHDGGKNWKDVVIGGNYAERANTSPYYGYACNTDPMGVFSADGTLHWVVELYNFLGKDGNGPAGKDPTSGRGIVQPGWKLVLATSHDGGDTFPEAATLEYGDGIGMLNDYSRITSNPKTGSTITVIDTYYPGAGANTALIPASPVQPPVPVPLGGVVCSVLPYRGAPAAPQQAPLQPTLVTGSANPGGLNCNGIAATSDGTVVLGAIGSPMQGGPPMAWFARSTDDGATFTDFSSGFSVSPIPSPFKESTYRTGTSFEMAYDNHDGPRKGTLYTITAESRDGDEADIFVRSSTDDGVSWSDPVRVNQDARGTHQFMPNVVVARDHSVHAFWMDKAYDTAHNHAWIDVSHGISLDGGRTWGTERVTNVSWDGELGKHQEGFPFIGDYTGIGSSGDEVWAGFPDASNGKTTVIAAIRTVLAR